MCKRSITVASYKIETKCFVYPPETIALNMAPSDDKTKGSGFG
jgi:hypothetical protein